MTSKQNIKTALDTYQPDTARYADDLFALLACQEAYRAVLQGNYGVGSLIVAASGEVLVRGHNQVFSPYFRSDLHAEMVVMNEFEDRYRDIVDMGGYTLYTSLEPCPMCLTRLICAGIGTVKYVAPDQSGAMGQFAHHLPPNWVNLSQHQSFLKANASPQLQALAYDIFMLNLPEMRQKLFDRRAGLC